MAYQLRRPFLMKSGSNPVASQMPSKSNAPVVEESNHAATSMKSHRPRPVGTMAYVRKSFTAVSSTASISRFSASRGTMEGSRTCAHTISRCTFGRTVASVLIMECILPFALI